jgi:hypothetical protein
MEHFENHGDKWIALGFEVDEIIDTIRYFIENGLLLSDYIYRFSQKSKIPFIQKKKFIEPLINSQSTPVKVLSLAEGIDNNKKQTLAYLGSYPILEGIKNRLAVTEHYTYRIPFEGEISFDFGKGFPLTFFAPFFHHDRQICKIGSIAEVYLAAYAFQLNLAPMSYSIATGDMYENALSDFLRHNPGKSRADYPSMELHMDDAVIVFPRDISTVYEYRGVILELENFEAIDKEITRAKIPLKRDRECDDEFCYCVYLYFKSDYVQELDLKVGSNIQGIISLTGYTQFKNLRIEE